MNNDYQRDDAEDASFENGHVIDKASIKNLVVDVMFTSGLIPGGDEIKQIINDSMPDIDD